MSAGLYHNVAVSSAGGVYAWGSGADCLGLGPDATQATEPTLIEALLPEQGGGSAVTAQASENRTCRAWDTHTLSERSLTLSLKYNR